VTTSGTITFGYPAGRSRGDYTLGVSHRLAWNGTVYRFGRDITIAFNASTVVVTLVATAAIPAGAAVVLELDRNGGGGEFSFLDQLRALDVRLSASGLASVLAPTVLLSMGSPITIDRDGIRASAAFTNPSGTTVATGTTLTLDGARVTGGVAILDVPRNVTIYSGSNISTFTFRVTGTDMYGVAMIEDIAGPNNSTTQGLKAFKTVTSVVAYGATTGNAATEVGFGKVLGLPVYVPNTGHVLLERENNAAPGGGAGTFVAGVISTPTATTGDPRGTYTPTATVDGSIGFHLLMALPHSVTGVTPFGITT
jgi:hypothetical protein